MNLLYGGETMDFWNDVKEDVQKGINEGLALVKTGANLAARKFGELTEEGKKWYKAFDMKSKVHGEIAELGARVYFLNKQGKLNLEDTRANAIIKRIATLEDKITKVEGKAPASPAKGRASARKKTPGKTTGGTSKASTSAGREGK